MELVLAGVADLSAPNHTYNEFDHSRPATGAEAAKSLQGSSIGDNQYAAMVAVAMEEAGIPRGSNIAIIEEDLEDEDLEDEELEDEELEDNE